MSYASPLRAWLAEGGSILACSTSAIFIKATTTPPIWLAAERLLLAALVMAPFAWRAAKQHGFQPRWWRNPILPGIFLAINFIAWANGARMIPAANSTLIGNLTPLVMPIIAWLVLCERASRWDLAATVVGLSGVALMAGGDLQATQSYLLGDMICFGSMLSVACYMAFSRRLRRGHLMVYMVLLYVCAGVICAIAALICEGLPPVPSGYEALLVLGLVIIPTVLGHTLGNYSLGLIRAQSISIVGLVNVPLAGLMAWILWREMPTPLFWLAGITSVFAVCMVVMPSLRRRPSVSNGLHAVSSPVLAVVSPDHG